jgi:hypothetical protein
MISRRTALLTGGAAVMAAGARGAPTPPPPAPAPPPPGPNGFDRRHS